MKKFTENIYIHSEKEENRELVNRAEELGFKNSDNLAYVGYEIEFEIEVDSDSNVKVLKIQGVDVSNLNIKI